ncbi:MAG: DNA-protecting protein DprA, partial [Planctomycetes bacterium]|nr:DNA-protecting protein DprA [Planctomycetota bacterium]
MDSISEPICRRTAGSTSRRSCSRCNRVSPRCCERATALNPSSIRRFARAWNSSIPRDRSRRSSVVTEVSRSCIHLVPRSRAWPAKLDQIEAPPSELWCVGSLALLEREPKVALIGTRAPTPYGQAQARAFATRLASAGVVIVSGLARGIDSEAHEAALDCQGATIAVLGSGVDRPWPAGPLAERMTVAGLLVSEYAPGTPPRRHHFPERNRLISGLCEAVIVIEAAYASGSLITARWAADQGRTVFALPGRVDHPMARGCHRLLREGASLVEDPEEVLVELGLAPSVPLEEAGAKRAAGELAAGELAAGDRAAGDRAAGDRAAGDRA